MTTTSGGASLWRHGAAPLLGIYDDARPHGKTRARIELVGVPRPADKRGVALAQPGEHRLQEARPALPGGSVTMTPRGIWALSVSSENERSSASSRRRPRWAARGPRCIGSAPRPGEVHQERSGLVPVQVGARVKLRPAAELLRRDVPRRAWTSARDTAGPPCGAHRTG